MAVVLEVVVDVLVGHDAGGGADVGLLDRDDHVGLQRVGGPFEQQRVGGQAGAADAKAACGDDVLDAQGIGIAPGERGQRGEVAVEASSTSFRAASSMSRARALRRNWRSQPSTTVRVSRSPARVAVRARSSASCKGPSVVWRVSAKSAVLVPCAKAWTRSA